MSTTQKMITDESLADMVAELKEWPNIANDNGEYELAVSPFLTFYFDYQPTHSLDASLSLIDTHEAFAILAGNPYTIATHPDSARPHPYGSKRLGDLREWASKKAFDKDFYFSVTDEKNNRSSPSTAGHFWRTSGMFYERDMELRYSYAQFYYRWQWWLDNRDGWRRFVHETIERLKPEQVYSGFAMANPLEFGTRSEVTVWDRALAPSFYGLDTDYPFGMDGRFALRKGIRPPTWAFFLSDVWRAKLGKSREEVHEALDHPRIRIDELSCGQWIELGEQPDLYPVEDGVPLLPVMLNKLLKPIRHPKLDLLGFGEWDGDPNVRFNAEDTRRWLGRFDEDSDWPDAATRARSPTPSTSRGLRVRSGQPCPYPAVWQCLERPIGPQTIAHGVPMPQVEGQDVTWQMVRLV
jgi:hypothetical protein